MVVEFAGESAAHRYLVDYKGGSLHEASCWRQIRQERRTSTVASDRTILADTAARVFCRHKTQRAPRVAEPVFTEPGSRGARR